VQFNADCGSWWSSPREGESWGIWFPPTATIYMYGGGGASRCAAPLRRQRQRHVPPWRECVFGNLTQCHRKDIIDQYMATFRGKLGRGKRDQ